MSIETFEETLPGFCLNGAVGDLDQRIGMRGGRRSLYDLGEDQAPVFGAYSLKSESVCTWNGLVQCYTSFPTIREFQILGAGADSVSQPTFYFGYTLAALLSLADNNASRDNNKFPAYKMAQPPSYRFPRSCDSQLQTNKTVPTYLRP